jgi:DNA replication protein DnaC
MTQLISDALPQVADVDHDDIVVPCRECQTEVPYKSSVLAFFGNNPRIVVCDDCCEDSERKSREENVVKPIGTIEDYIPQLYLETDFNLLPKQAQHLWRYGYENEKMDSPPIQNWSTKSDKGIYILGDSRTGKTRTLCILLRKLFNDGVKFKLFLAGQFHAQLTEAKRSTNYSAWIRDMVKVPVLAIDDLFAEKLTATTQAGLFEVIEQRMANKRPLLITTQVRRSDAITQFDDPRRGSALLNRLRESCDLYLTNNKVTQETMKV